MATAELEVGGEIDIDAAELFAAGPSLAHGRQQEGMHGDPQQAAEFLVGPAIGGCAEQALDGGGQRAVAGEAHVAEPEQAEAIEAVRVAGGIEAAIVVEAAQVGDLAEVAEGGAAGGLAEGVLELSMKH